MYNSLPREFSCTNSSSLSNPCTFEHSQHPLVELWVYWILKNHLLLLGVTSVNFSCPLSLALAETINNDSSFTFSMSFVISHSFIPPFVMQYRSCSSLIILIIFLFFPLWFFFLCPLADSWKETRTAPHSRWKHTLNLQSHTTVFCLFYTCFQIIANNHLFFDFSMLRNARTDNVNPC